MDIDCCLSTARASSSCFCSVPRCSTIFLMSAMILPKSIFLRIMYLNIQEIHWPGCGFSRWKPKLPEKTKMLFEKKTQDPFENKTNKIVRLVLCSYVPRVPRRHGRKTKSRFLTQCIDLWIIVALLFLGFFVAIFVCGSSIQKPQRKISFNAFSRGYTRGSPKRPLTHTWKTQTYEPLVFSIPNLKKARLFFWLKNVWFVI